MVVPGVSTTSPPGCNAMDGGNILMLLYYYSAAEFPLIENRNSCSIGSNGRDWLDWLDWLD